MLRSISKQSGESVISLLYGICYVLVVSHYAEIIDPVCHVCGACKVCEARAYVCLSVCLSACLSVCLSVRPFHHPAATRRCGGFAAVGPAARRYRSTAALPALSSKCGQCHVVS